MSAQMRSHTITRMMKAKKIHCEVFPKRVAGQFAAVIFLMFGFGMFSAAHAQGRAAAGAAAVTPKDNAAFDMTGYWVSIVDEDWRWRMLTPAKGDYISVPLNDAGLKVAEAWDPKKDEADGNQCKAYGAGNIMRMPERLHITWENASTMRMDIDAGTQSRLFHFDGSKWQQGATPDWQGDSVATWEKRRGVKGGDLAVVTRHMRAGYLRKNGVPYSENMVLTEYYSRFEIDGQSYMTVTSVVEEPLYLRDRFITSGQFKLETDGSKWNPTPCRPLWPRAPMAVAPKQYR